jgi:hypothetical protein
MVFHANQSRNPHESAMPLEQRPACTLASHAAAQPVVPWSRALALRAYTMQWAGHARKFYTILGVPGSTTLLVGAVLAVACMVWALRLEVPFPVALLAGYITVAASACICAALVAVRHSPPRPATKTAPKCAPTTESIRKSSEPDYAAWARVDRLRVADASRLWCGIEPGHAATPEVMAWADAILEALRRGEMPRSHSTGALMHYRIGWHTEIPRDELKVWARSKGYAPRFLYDG